MPDPSRLSPRSPISPQAAPAAPAAPSAGMRTCSLDQLRGPRRPSPHARLRLVAVTAQDAGHEGGPGAPDDALRLALLGIRPGAELRLLQAPGPRGAVLGVGTARIALGRELVRRLQVVEP